MKSKRKNIIKNLAEKAAVKNAVLQLFIIHLVLAHVVLQSFIICFENDGGIVLESMADNQFCCANLTLAGETEYLGGKAGEECDLCEDVAVSDNCDEEYSLTVKKHQTLNASILIDLSSQNILREEKKSTLFTQEINYKSNQLDSYKTVLLLI